MGDPEEPVVPDVDEPNDIENDAPEEPVVPDVDEPNDTENDAPEEPNDAEDGVQEEPTTTSTVNIPSPPQGSPNPPQGKGPVSSGKGRGRQITVRLGRVQPPISSSPSSSSPLLVLF